jgi:hypothetical protein
MISLTAKIVPTGVPNIKSTITRSPEIAHALMDLQGNNGV